MAVTLNLPKTWRIGSDRFAELAQINQDLRLELTAEGELIVMPPTGGETGYRNFEIYVELGIWNRQYRLGKGFDSSTGFRLPNGAIRSPDVSWIAIARWNELTPESRKKFLPLCPDFAIELVSETDEISGIRDKMREYLDNGSRLGWSIAPKTRVVEIYRPNREVEVLVSPTSVSGEDVLPDFVLNLAEIWN